jgi:hypothetical protein
VGRRRRRQPQRAFLDHDSDLSVAILDHQRNTRPPADAGGLGDGARHFVRDLRLAPTREHLDLEGGADDDLATADELLLDPDRTAHGSAMR